jgi:hypothetical protein
MKNARKRFLVTADQLNRIEQRNTPHHNDDDYDEHFDPDVNPYYIPHPSAKIARTSGRKARALLAADSIPEFDKTILHAQELSKYLQSLRDALIIPKATAYTGVIDNNSPPPPPPPPAIQPVTTTGAATTPKRRKPARPRRTRPPSNPSPSAMMTTSNVPHASTTPSPSQPTPPQTPAKKSQASVATTVKDITRPYATQRLVADLTPNDDDDRARLDTILNRLETNPNFRWNWRTGRVHYEGRTRQSSNIKSLLADALADRRQLSTKGDFDALQKALRE